MLYVKQLFLIDSAEEKGQWLRRAKEQWGADHPIAVRVTDNASHSLGSTIPKELVYDAERDSWCASWLAAPVKRQLPTGEDDDEGVATVRAEDVASTAASAEVPSDADQATAGQSQPDTPSEAATAPVAETGQSDTDAAQEAPAEASAATEEETTTATEAASATVASPAAAGGELIGIDVSAALSTGFVVLEVVTLSGEVKCTAITNLSSVTRGKPVEHFTMVLTPLSAEAMDDSAIHGVLELTVVGQTDGTEGESCRGSDGGRLTRDLVDFDAGKPVPTPVRHPSVSLSTDHLYFPTSFLTGTGAFIVSNVVCVESASDKVVNVEFVVTGDSNLIKVSPATATLDRKGERQFFICTWDMFKPFRLKSKEDAAAPLVKVHALLREGGVNVPPVDFTMHAELPRPTDTNPNFLFWVNTTMVSNAPCSEAEVTAVRSQLPVYEIQKKITGSSTADAERRRDDKDGKRGTRPWWRLV